MFQECKIQTECVKQLTQVSGRSVSMVNCPDWSTTTPPSQKVLLCGVELCSPGPNAVLVTVDVSSSFSEAHRRSVEEHMELLGDRVWRHALVLFTWGFWLGDGIEEYLESEGEPLKWLLEKCAYRYHVLRFLRLDVLEVTELMQKIEDMTTRNGGHFRMEHNARQTSSWTVSQRSIVAMEPEEPTLSAMRRSSMDHHLPSCEYQRN